MVFISSGVQLWMSTIAGALPNFKMEVQVCCVARLCGNSCAAYFTLRLVMLIGFPLLSGTNPKYFQMVDLAFGLSMSETSDKL